MVTARQRPLKVYPCSFIVELLFYSIRFALVVLAKNRAKILGNNLLATWGIPNRLISTVPCKTIASRPGEFNNRDLATKSNKLQMVEARNPGIIIWLITGASQVSKATDLNLHTNFSPRTFFALIQNKYLTNYHVPGTPTFPIPKQNST